jgi:hypothetical protein
MSEIEFEDVIVDLDDAELGTIVGGTNSKSPAIS